MKSRIFVLTLMVFLGSAFCRLAEAQTYLRTAVVTDKAGVSTEVSKVWSEGSDTRLAQKLRQQELMTFYPGGYLVVLTEPFFVGIPLRYVISVQRKATEFEVRYIFRGRETAISGSLSGGKITGESDFGKFSLPTEKLKELRFKTPPVNYPDDPSQKPRVIDTLLLLRDGTQVPVAELHRLLHYWSTYGYIVGGKWERDIVENFAFLRGDSQTVVVFDQLKSIEFGPANSVTITLKSGSVATGKLPDSGEWAMEGFFGLCDKGWFFLAPEHVKTVQFGAGLPQPPEAPK